MREIAIEKLELDGQVDRIATNDELLTRGVTYTRVFYLALKCSHLASCALAVALGGAVPPRWP